MKYEEKSEWFMDNRNGFLSYKPTREDLLVMEDEYKRDFKKSNILNTKTIYNKEESRKAGILGEIVFGKWAGLQAVRHKGLLYDFILNNNKIDVKCKFRTVPPRPNFEASFFSYQGAEYYKEVDYYAFLSTITNYSQVWFCAWATKDGFIKNPKGIFWKAGMVDPTNGKEFHEDTFSVFYQDLKRPTLDKQSYLWYTLNEFK
jgi:hypothetical protein